MNQVSPPVMAGIVDCDIHPLPRSMGEVLQFLPERWRGYAAEYGMQMRAPFPAASTHPRMTPFTSRLDAWPPSGGPPGSDLDFMRAQHLDPNNVALGILQPLRPPAASHRNLDFGAALCTAVNQWQAEYFLAQEPRLRGSIVVHPEHPEAAVAEIARWARHPGFVQLTLPPRGSEPLGRRRYWPVLEAAAAHGLPVGLHVSGVSGHAVTAGGWPSYYIEEHQSLVAMMQATVASLVLEGVFERLPTLKVAMVEAGFAWVPPLAGRMDRAWRRLKSEVPALRRAPSEYLREHIWYTTQPIDEPERREDLIDLIDQIGWDRVMFSTDYPHWDFDDPAHILASGATAAQRQAVFRDNALGFFGVTLP